MDVSDHCRGYAAPAQDARCCQSLRGAAVRCRNDRWRRRVWHPTDFRL